ncbi:MAG: DUF177 domain-containing protein [Flavobacteriales bacterium]|nr:DUF177 domain-containing protein [Flavobacteriales bacterium]
MDNKYQVRFSGLALGVHQFEFPVEDDFFESIEFGEIRKGKLSVVIDMVKEENMMVLDFAISGTVNITCDRCSELFDQKIEGQHQLIVKFGDKGVQNTDDILFVPRIESEIQVASYIYEFTHLMLPQKRVHPEGECNQEIVDKLAQMGTANKFEGGDPRWDALRKVL